MKRVYIASPYRGRTPAETALNVAYAQAALLDSLARGEAPVAPHLMYPAVLDDSDRADRAMAMAAGLALIAGCDVLAVYTDRGAGSMGVACEVELAESAGIRIERRSLEGWAL